MMMLYGKWAVPQNFFVIWAEFAAALLAQRLRVGGGEVCGGESGSRRLQCDAGVMYFCRLRVCRAAGFASSEACFNSWAFVGVK